MQPVLQIELDGYEAGDFEVVSFSATETVSSLFLYTITLAARERLNDFDKLLEAKAHFTFGDPQIADKMVHVRGMLSFVQQGYDPAWAAEAAGPRTRVDVVLVPEMWKLTLNVQTRFFMDMNVPDVITKIMGEYGLTFEAPAAGTHPLRETILQYQESDFEFLSRLCEHEGIHYHFVHGDAEKVVFADANSAFQEIKNVPDMPLRDPRLDAGSSSHTGPWGEEKTVQRFQSRQQFVPKKTILHDYNYMTPSTDLVVKGEAEGKAAEGVQYAFAENYKDTDQGEVLRKLREEEIMCRKRVFSGAGNNWSMYAGGVFKLHGTERIDADLAQDYVITDFHAEGSQPIEHMAEGQEYHFNCTFTCIPKSIPFRPPLKARWPDMKGLYHAKIVGSGAYAEVEEEGRYRVKFLFDLESGDSIPVRLMEPYVGGQYGFHAPLHEGVEVLVGFEYGDPDRAIIVAAVHNPDFPNTVVGDNHAQSVFRSAGQNELRFDDTQGEEHVFLHGTKDWNINIDNDKTQNITRDEKHNVGQDLTINVKRDTKGTYERDFTTSTGRDQKHEITGKRETVITGTEDFKVTGAMTVEGKGGIGTTVSGGDHTTKVTGNHSATVSGVWNAKADGNAEIKSGASIAIDGTSEILLKCGGSSIKIDPGSITIKAASIKVIGDAQVEISAPVIKNVGQGLIDVNSSGLVNVSGGGPVVIKGPVVQVN